MSFMDSLDISGSGLTAQKYRMEIVAENLANAGTTRTEGGGPYRRKLVVLSEADGSGGFAGALRAASGGSAGGVRVSAVVDDNDDFR